MINATQMRRLKARIKEHVDAAVEASTAGTHGPEDAAMVRAEAKAAEAKLEKYLAELMELP